jgi:hypothetical protein
MDSNLTMEIFTLWSREMAMEIIFLSRGKITNAWNFKGLSEGGIHGCYQLQMQEVNG